MALVDCRSFSKAFINVTHLQTETCLPPQESSSVSPLWQMMLKVRLSRYMILDSRFSLANVVHPSVHIERAKLARSPSKSLQYETQWRRSS
jgi:hypothetical protein